VSRYTDGYKLRILGSNFSDAALESAHTEQSQLQYLCALSKYLSGVFLFSYYCFSSMFLIFLFTFYFTLFTFLFIFISHQVPLGRLGSRAAGIGLLLLRACLNEPVRLGVCVSLVNYCIMRRPFQ